MVGSLSVCYVNMDLNPPIRFRTFETALALADGMSLLKGKGYRASSIFDPLIIHRRNVPVSDMNSVWEQPVAWGENDSFRCALLGPQITRPTPIPLHCPQTFE